MANTDAPCGLKPVGHITGGPWNGMTNTYYVASGDAAAIFIGDPVKIGGSADPTGRYPDVAVCTTGDQIQGVMVGVGMLGQDFDPSDLDLKYREASTNTYIQVVDDPTVIFEIQEDGTSAVTGVNLNYDLLTTAGSSTTGLSGMELDTSSATAGTASLRLLRYVDREDNAVGEHAKMLVRIVEHAALSVTGG